MKQPRLSLICRADNSGLGTLSREFADHLKPDKILITANGVFQTFPERYKDFDVKIARPAMPFTDEQKTWLTKDIDVLLSIETFYDWSIIAHCRRANVKTALVTMCEMMPEYLPRNPDLFLCPSKLDDQVCARYGVQKKMIPIPLNIEKLEWRKRGRAEVFVHSASHGGQNNRKGTHLVMDAMKYVQSPIKLIIYSWMPFVCKDPRVEVRVQNFKNYWQVWQEGDVLIYPQDYNGICLPIIEAMTSGLGVITTNIFPFNEYMPKELMFEPREMYKTKAQMGNNEMLAAKIDPKTIAAKIDEVYGMDMGEFSDYGKEWGKQNSWEVRLPEYKLALKNLCL